MNNLDELICAYESRGTTLQTSDILRQFAKWKRAYHDLNIEHQKIRSLLRKTSLSEHPDIQQQFMEGVTRDILTSIVLCFRYYQKVHKIELPAPDATIVSTVTAENIQDCIDLYNDTIRPMERRYHYFSRRKRSRSSTTPRTLSRFNVFVREQWKNRYEELKALGRANGSKAVMVKLGKEWTMMKSENNPPTVDAI